MTGARGTWDDARLDAAFAARAAAAPATPPDLASGIRELTARQPRSSILSVRRLAPTFGAAAAIALAVIVGAGQLVKTPSAASDAPSSAPGPLGSNPSAEPEASAPAGVNAMLGAAISVRQAVAIRDRGVDDRELVVTGFLGGAGLRLPCPMPLRSGNPTRLDCPQGFAWLMQDPEALVSTLPDGSGGVHPPVGAAIHPSFALVDQPGGQADGLADPRPMTVVGHFDDRRAALCIAEQVADCRDTFIVDRVVSGDDLAVPGTTVGDETPSRVSSAAAVDALVRGVAPGVAVLSNRVVPGGRIVPAEPALTGDPSWSRAKAVWIVTALALRDGTPVARTFLIIDGRTDVVEMTTTGPVRLAAEIPSALPASSSPDDTAITDLLDHPISVSEAIDRRDTALDDTELALEGFGWGPSGFLSCPMIRPGLPVKAQCPGYYTWISDREPAPTENNELPQPDGPALNLLIQPETIRAVNIYRADPVRIIALGHFDDHRSATCVANPDECRRNFIVDAIVDPADLRIDRTIQLGRVDPAVRPVLTSAHALERMGLTATDPRLVVVFAVRIGALQEIEPLIGHAPELGGAEIVWIVRWVDRDGGSRPVLRTTMTIDADPARSGTQAWQVTAAGLEPVDP